jgi:hypothetical protein
MAASSSANSATTAQRTEQQRFGSKCEAGSWTGCRGGWTCSAATRLVEDAAVIWSAPPHSSYTVTPRTDVLPVLLMYSLYCCCCVCQPGCPCLLIFLTACPPAGRALACVPATVLVCVPAVIMPCILLCLCCCRAASVPIPPCERCTACCGKHASAGACITHVCSAGACWWPAAAAPAAPAAPAAGETGKT